MLKCRRGDGARRRADHPRGRPLRRGRHDLVGRGVGHGPGHPRVPPGQYLRSLRHDQAKRNGTRAGHLPRHRRRPSRQARGAQQYRTAGQHLHAGVLHREPGRGRSHRVRTALVVSGDEALRARLQRALEHCSVFAAASDEEALKTLRITAMELVIKEALPPMREVPAFIARVRHLCPNAAVICVLPAGATSPEEEAAGEAADFSLVQPFTSREVQGVLRQAEDKLRLLQEVAALRSARRAPGGESGPEDSELGLEASSHALTQVAKEFAKALAAGFDLPRVLDLFLDAVSEMARPSRSAILLAEEEHRQYRVRASRGLAPHLVDSVTLSADSGLPLWLMAEGRLIQIEEAHGRATDPAAREIAREMAVLQAVVAIPLLAHGELVGILLLGQRITGGAYTRRDTETLFSLASPLATAIRDIRVHHQLQYQKEFTERILQRMSSGVITIGPEQRVVIMNRRAEEILGMAAKDVLNRDLRALPSPLGDL